MAKETLADYIQEMTPEQEREFQKAWDAGCVLPHYSPEEEEKIRKLAEGVECFLFEPKDTSS